MKLVDPSYAAKQTMLAIHDLIGPSLIRDRLRSAYGHLGMILDEDLPDELRPLLASIRAALTKRQPRFDGDNEQEATLYRMRAVTARRIANMIWELDTRLTEYLAQTRSLTREVQL